MLDRYPTNYIMPICGFVKLSSSVMVRGSDGNRPNTGAASTVDLPGTRLNILEAFLSGDVGVTRVALLQS